MKIEKISWHGIDAVLLETNVYEAILVPSMGANLIKLYNKEKQVDILRTPTKEDMETFLSRPQIFGVPLLFPPNRIEDGMYTFEGKKYVYPITIPAQHNYHHGILKSQVFNVTRTHISAKTVEVEASFFSNRINRDIFVNFPHEFICTMKFVLSDTEMTQTVTFTNLGTERMPLGVGYHTPIRLPFTKGSDKSDYKLRLSAGKRWELSERSLPTGNILNLSAEESLLRGDGLNPTGKPIEIALTDEAILEDGKPYHGAILINTKENISVYYEVDSQFKHWTLWNNGGEVDWVCPEPQTWAINAPNLKLPAETTGFQAVDGGMSWSGTTKFYVK